MAKRLNLVVTVNADANGEGDDFFGDIIGVYEDFDEAIKMRDKLNDRESIIPGLDLSLLAYYTSAEVITRDLNTHFKNSDT